MLFRSIFLNLFSRQLCIQNSHSCVRLISSQYFAYTPEQLPNYRQHGRPRECTWRFLVVYHCNFYSSYRGSIAYTPSSAPRSPATSSTRKDANLNIQESLAKRIIIANPPLCTMTNIPNPLMTTSSTKSLFFSQFSTISKLPTSAVLNTLFQNRVWRCHMLGYQQHFLISRRLDSI